MYTLYHLKGNKWGMTRRTLNQRFSDHDYRKKGLTINDVCETETYSDRDIAADRERELNLRDGYGWNKSGDYRIVTKRSRNGGLRQGVQNVKSGHWSKVQLIGSKLPSYHGRKLTYEQAEYIRAQYKRGKDVFGKTISQRRLAAIFDVSHPQIIGILKNRTYTIP